MAAAAASSVVEAQPPPSPSSYPLSAAAAPPHELAAAGGGRSSPTGGGGGPPSSSEEEDEEGERGGVSGSGRAPPLGIGGRSRGVGGGRPSLDLPASISGGRSGGGGSGRSKRLRWEPRQPPPDAGLVAGVAALWEGAGGRVLLASMVAVLLPATSAAAGAGRGGGGVGQSGGGSGAMGGAFSLCLLLRLVGWGGLLDPGMHRAHSGPFSRGAVGIGHWVCTGPFSRPDMKRLESNALLSLRLL